MATGDVEVQVRALTDGANAINTQKTNMMNYVSEAVNYINGINWEGDAHDAFNSTLATMAQRFQNADEVLQTYVQFLNNAADNYIQNESTRVSDNQSFDGGL